jgi:hypothetical protein
MADPPERQPDPASPAESGAVASPCIGLCMMDDTLGHCLGCGRTRAEIGRWLGLTSEQRRAVVRRASARVGRPLPDGEAAAGT